ncbi:TPA_asm: NS1 [Abeoforma parvovirus]|nr:TPA_asm: NS1 [Abeoforma parvovirus]
MSKTTYDLKVLTRGKRIEELLKANNYSEDRIKFFLKSLMLVVQRRAGKKNTFYLMGRSNSGKSMLMETFVRAYFNHNFGSPNGNVKSSFPFAVCICKRILLWEEPIVNAINFEDAKKVLGGQQHRTDQKYQTGAEISSTPVIMTSNRPVWAVVPTEVEVFKNRCFIFNLNVPIDPASNLIPILKIDWDIFINTYLYECSLNTIAYRMDNQVF